MVVPCLTTLISSHCEESKKGSCMGVFRSIGTLARACGPIFGSFCKFFFILNFFILFFCKILAFWLLGPMYSYMLGAILLTIPIYQLFLIKKYRKFSKNTLKLRVKLS